MLINGGIVIIHDKVTGTIKETKLSMFSFSLHTYCLSKVKDNSVHVCHKVVVFLYNYSADSLHFFEE